jgi:integrase
MASRKRTCTKRTWTTSKGVVRTAWVVDFLDASGKRRRRQFESKSEADYFRVGTEGQLRAGTFRSDAAKQTVRSVAELYKNHIVGREHRKERMTRRHREVVEGLIDNHVLHAEHGVGGLSLSQLSSSKVIEFRDRLRSAGVSVQTTRKILGTLSRILSYAISKDFIAVNTATGVTVIGRRDEGPKKIVPPTKAAFRRLLEEANDDFRVVVVFAAATAVRASELWALRWRHITNEGVRVETRVDRYGVEDTTKTEAGVRTVPIAAEVVTLLKAWRLRSKFSKPDDLIFPNNRGGYTLHANMARRTFGPLRKKAGMPGIGWHALRHFAISCWIEEGLMPKTVQTFAGHSSLEMTMDRYGHLFPSEDHQKAMDRIGKALLT